MDVLESRRQVTSIAMTDRHGVRSPWEVPVSAVVVSLGIRRGPEGSGGALSCPQAHQGRARIRTWDCVPLGSSVPC